MQFKADRHVPWTQPAADAGIIPREVFLGPDPDGLGSLQVATADAVAIPSRTALRELYMARRGRRQITLVIAVTHGENAYLFGPDPQASTVELPVEAAHRHLQSALAEPDVELASERLAGFRKAYETTAPGFTNSGLFATHHVMTNLRNRTDWASLGEAGRVILSHRNTKLIEALGFHAIRHTTNALLLASDGHAPRAVAVLINETEQFDQKTARLSGSPVAYGLAVAQQQGIPWLIVVRKDQIRLYPGRDGIGVGAKGQTETYFEIDLATIDADHAALIPLIFSAAALADDGSAAQILTDSARYAAELSKRLRERVYGEVVPPLAVEVAGQLVKQGWALNALGLSTAYQVTLRILFRLLFQAYAEDRGLLPAGRNEGFDANSLKSVGRRLLKAGELELGDAPLLWRGLEQVWLAIDKGQPLWQIPAYNGGLFASDATRSPDGALIASIQLPDRVLAPALRSLLIDRTEDGTDGLVDFRSLSVREFGTIYEGLLESSLSQADQDLTEDSKGTWVAAKDGDEVLVAAGGVYFHSASGERKATGSYFTPKVVVDHLIERSIVPALTKHLERIAAHLQAGDAAAASRIFFDFRVADLAMGSGHFLVAAIDKIEALMRTFLTQHSVPGVTEELRRLSEVAKEALGTDDVAKLDVDEVGLLRRQIARRCIYGLDINLMAVELARLALWIHTFVPGLPMSNLDHGLVCANSLTGIGTIDEAIDALAKVAETTLLIESNADVESGEKTKSDDEGLALAQDVLFGSVQPDLASASKRLHKVKASVGYKAAIRALVREHLDKATRLLVDVANASEATKAEVAHAGEQLARAREASTPVTRLFDAAVAIRMGAWSAHITTESTLRRLTETDEPSKIVAPLRPAHLPALFPEVFLRDDAGFDVLLGNPPWDKVRHEPTSFWAVRDPGLNSLSDEQRKTRINELRVTRLVDAADEQGEEAARQELQQLFKKAFEWRGGTHLELAQLFLERALKSVRSTGEVALVLPRQFTVLAGWKTLRSKLFANHDTLLVQGRNKGEWLFENVHASYAVVMLNASPLSCEPIRVGVVASAEGLRKFGPSAALTFTRDELADLSDAMAVPWFNNPGDRAVFDKMRAFPRISRPGSWVRGVHDARWDFRGTGPDRDLAVRADAPGGWSVMMTRHVDAYALRPAPVKQFIADLPTMVRKGRGIETDREGQTEIGADHPVVIFRHPSRSDDTRTLIAAALPAEGWIYNKGYVHAFAHDAQTGANERLAVLGLLNSVVEDWWARRFVDRHVTAPVINNLPVPALSQEGIRGVADRVAVLLSRTGLTRLAGGIDLPARASASGLVNNSDLELLAGIDAIVARGYGLGAADLACVREDFGENGYPAALFAQTCESLAD